MASDLTLLLFLGDWIFLGYCFLVLGVSPNGKPLPRRYREGAMGGLNSRFNRLLYGVDYRYAYADLGLAGIDGYCDVLG